MSETAWGLLSLKPGCGTYLSRRTYSQCHAKLVDSDIGSSCKHVHSPTLIDV